MTMAMLLLTTTTTMTTILLLTTTMTTMTAMTTLTSVVGMTEAEEDLNGLLDAEDPVEQVPVRNCPHQGKLLSALLCYQTPVY